MQSSIDELILFRDKFFLENPNSCSKERNRLLREKCLLLLQDVTLANDAASKVKYNIVCGKILNILPEWDGKCEEYLSRAVKLEPDLVEGWNELGECLWKKGDVAGAQHCFQTALQKGRTCSALKNMAMSCRHEGGTSEQRRENIRKSLNLAKEACDLCPADSSAWYSLGNAYLAYFFACAQQNSSYIDNCLVAYEKAIELGQEQFNPDLYFNFAQALRYEESYSRALSCLERTLSLDPEFSEAKDKLDNLVAFLSRVTESVHRKGKLKAKRLNQMLASLEVQTGLGPYAEKRVETPLQPQTLLQLRPGPNLHSVLVCKVIGLCVNEETIPYSCSVMDESGSSAALTVYNFSDKFGLVIGECVAFPDPFVLDVCATFRDQKFEFRSIRVPSPEVLVVNGKKLSNQNVAMIQVSLVSGTPNPTKLSSKQNL